MMNDTEAIKIKTGFYPGDVFHVDKERTKYSKRYGEKLYDEKSGNFHIVPDDDDVIIDMNFVIINTRNLLKEKLNEKLKKLRRDNPNAEITFNKGTGSKGGADNLKIEKFIEVIKDGFKNMLCFERLYTDGENVNCILGLYQFYKYPIDHQYINLLNGKFEMFYPPSSKPTSKFKKEDTEDTEDTHLVINPNLPSVFETDDKALEEVCNAFIEFIG